MKINNIHSINSLGCYQNFRWDNDTPNFCQFNFFYGWNYSGKTTISKIFRALEIKKLIIGFENASFKLDTDNGVVSEREINNEYSIRVFNEEFIEEFVDFDGRIKPKELEEKFKKKVRMKKKVKKNAEFKVWSRKKRKVNMFHILQ